MLFKECIVIVLLIFGATCQLPCLEPPVNQNDPTGMEYIGNQTFSDNGTCAQWISASGNVNYLSSSQFPDISIQNAKNYCRNPKGLLGTYESRPWCWLQSNPNTFGFCTIQSCANICRNTYIGETYRGLVSTTITGKQCQSWNSQTPHSHQYNSGNWPITGETIGGAGNNCRNPNNSSYGLWCYTMDSVIIWEPCMAPVCKSTTGCVNSITNYLFKSLTATEQYLQSCVPWGNISLRYDYSNPTPIISSPNNVDPIFHPALLPDDNLFDASNYCRNPDNDVNGAWCYVTNGTNFFKKYCKTPCSGIWACLYDRTGSYYQGTVSVTESNLICASWNSKIGIYVNSNFPENSVVNAQNYCRNPTNNIGGPWCWLASNPTQFGYCSIPICQQTPPIPPLVTSLSNFTCQLTASGVEYSGTISVTKSNIACAPWTSTTFYNPYFNRSILFNTSTMAEVSNYCRNPNNDPLGPWCYQLGSGSPDYCDIPKCFTTTVSPLPTRNNCRTTLAATEYTGTINTAADGTPCINWKDVSNLLYNNTQFADGSIANAVNYCRNPQATDFIGPFCYTASGSRVACVVPICSTSACRTTVEGYTYGGTQAVSKSGLQCIPWTNISLGSIDPNYLPDQSLSAARNYCRNPSSLNAYDGPFCYTSPTTAETCNINYCVAQCRNSQAATDYAGIVNRSNNIPCIFWSDPRNIDFRNPQTLNAATLNDAANYCRNPDNDPLGPWCYTSSQTKGYCQLPVCSPTTSCYTQNNAWSYTGTTNVTSNGIGCLKWFGYQPLIPDPSTPQYMPQLLPDASEADAQNYCRTPTNQTAFTSRPWCFIDPILINGSLTTFGFCNVSICVSCYTFANISQYNGYTSVTSNGIACLQWSTLDIKNLSKLSGPTFVPSLLVDSSITAANNYCRIPTRDLAYISQPWCYVSPSSVISQTTGQNFGFCNVTTCPTTPITGPINTFQNYFMNIFMALFIGITTFSLSSTTLTIINMSTEIFAESNESMLFNGRPPLPPQPIESIVNQTHIENNQSQPISNKIIGTTTTSMNSLAIVDSQTAQNQMIPPADCKYSDIKLGYDSSNTISISANERITPENYGSIYGAPKIIATEMNNNYSLEISSNLPPYQNSVQKVVKVNALGSGIPQNSALIIGGGMAAQGGGFGGQGGGMAAQGGGFGGQGGGMAAQGGGFGGQSVIYVQGNNNSSGMFENGSGAGNKSATYYDINLTNVNGQILSKKYEVINMSNFDGKSGGDNIQKVVYVSDHNVQDLSAGNIAETNLIGSGRNAEPSQMIKANPQSSNNNNDNDQYSALDDLYNEI